jgi:hypothetical protein
MLQSLRSTQVSKRCSAAEANAMHISKIQSV